MESILSGCRHQTPPPDDCLCGPIHLSRPRRGCPLRLSRGLVLSDGPYSSSFPGASSAATSRMAAPRGRGHVHGGDTLCGHATAYPRWQPLLLPFPRGLVCSDISRGCPRAASSAATDTTQARPRRRCHSGRSAGSPGPRLASVFVRNGNVPAAVLWPSEPDGRLAAMHRSDGSDPPPSPEEVTSTNEPQLHLKG